MSLQSRPFRFSTITHHANVTQCLGSIGGHVWYLGVAKPSLVDSKEVEKEKRKIAVQSRFSHFYLSPAIDDVHVFRISGPKFIKLNCGTWHAGPLFRADAMDFYNLELSDTNIKDALAKSIGVNPCSDPIGLDNRICLGKTGDDTAWVAGMSDRHNPFVGAQGQTRSAGSGGVVSRIGGYSVGPFRRIFEEDFSGRALG
ncbi:pentatricopeptide repeat-containing protein [Hibiscus syriacus]|uniref:Pentatricopeptide repeat-containing protein n=1 Tax=Hibiscus syriacus TaxID=106335 RepID=A0A6A2YCQ8_HIBSY|nr:pentatricopeptide repeat-containing protein [Hibiscus syriacus]